MNYLNLLNNEGVNEIEFLKNYKPGDYARPSVTVDMLLFTVQDKISDNIKKVPDKELKVLLIKRKNHPYICRWAIPGGFVDINESLDEAARRELKEETNIDNVYTEQLGTYGDVKRDPRMRVISVANIALVSSENLKPCAGDDAEDVAWFTIKKEDMVKTSDKTVFNLVLESSEKDVRIVYKVTETFTLNGVSKIKNVDYTLSSDVLSALSFDHAKIVLDALDRLENKIEYTSIAFNLLPNLFTLSELQKVYEAILNRPLEKSNFRKKIRPMLIETDYVNNSVAYRPAKYYKFNIDWSHEF